MKENIASYITAMINVLDRNAEMVSTATVTDHLHDLLDFVMDLPEEIIPFAYDEDGSDGMSELNVTYPLN